MLHLNQAIIVEGKYDKIKISSIIDAFIIVTNGYQLYKDKEKMELIRYYANTSGVIILTDSDSAGFKIRNYIKGSIKDGKIYNVYIPDIFGKEKRKTISSKEGKLGVEGIPKDIILKAFENAGVIFSEKQELTDPITRADFYEYGLMGNNNSTSLRKIVLKHYSLPELLSITSMIDVLNTMTDRIEFLNTLSEILKLNVD